MATMTLREMNLRVFRGEPVPHVFFQPRFEPWYAWQGEFGKRPAGITGLSLREVYDLVGASMRYVHYYTGQVNPVETAFTEEVKVTEKREGEYATRRIETPHGPLFAKSKLTTDKNWRVVEFPAKTADDLSSLRWLVDHRVVRFSPEKFRAGARFVGERGEPQFWVPKSPYFSLAQQWMKYEDFVYALADARDKVEDVMRAIDGSYDRLYEDLVANAGGPGRVNIVNFGENIDMAYLSPRYFEECVLPWYEKRSGQLRRAGIHTHVHIDGHFRPLLQYFAGLPFDGLEALTPTPQGDVTLEEIKEHIGEKVLLDGIPAVLFLQHHPREEFEAAVKKIVELFHPRLVLGISDELPEAGDEESFERLKWVAEYARAHRAGE